jgi:hypothetical protein
MIVYLVIREEKRFLTSNRLFTWLLGKFGLCHQYRSAVLAVHSDIVNALVMALEHASYRVFNDNAIVLRSTEYHPKPVEPGTRYRIGGTPNNPIEVAAPEVISCNIREIELLERDGKSRTLYRVVQEWVVAPECEHEFKNYTACVKCKEKPL